MTTTGLRVSRVIAAALIAGVGSYALLRLSGLLPPVPAWPAILVLVLLAVFVVAAAWPVRRLRQGRATRPVPALRAARTLVFAQAAALTGAVMAGWYAAQAALLVPDLDVDSQRHRLWLLLGIVVASIVLSVSGLVAQRMCRLDPPEDQQPDGLPG